MLKKNDTKMPTSEFELRFREARLKQEYKFVKELGTKMRSLIEDFIAGITILGLIILGVLMSG